ncbi:MAG: hypothetical protein AAGK66_01465 [Pseudomonadota bacterium]
MTIQSATQAQEIAERYIQDGATQTDWRFEFVEVSKRPDKVFWAVIFDVYSPENTLVDGPVVILVRKRDGLAISLQDAFEQNLIDE